MRYQEPLHQNEKIKRGVRTRSRTGVSSATTKRPEPLDDTDTLFERRFERAWWIDATISLRPTLHFAGLRDVGSVIVGHDVTYDYSNMVTLMRLLRSMLLEADSSRA